MALKYIDGCPYVREHEISILSRLRHKNVVNLLDLLVDRSGEDGYEDDDDDYEEEEDEEIIPVLVLEYAPLVLEALLDELRVPFPDARQLKCFVKQISEGLNYIHGEGVVHRDVSPANILIAKGVAKLSDFGQARLLVDGQGKSTVQGQMTPDVCTLWYRAPEILLNKDYTFAVDLWSFGCLIAETVMGKPLFDADTETEELARIDAGIKIDPETGKMAFTQRLPEDTPSELVDLLCSMLSYDPDTRITAPEVLRHPYLITGDAPSDKLDVKPSS